MMGTEQKYAIHVHPDIVTGTCSVETVMSTKHTTSAEVVDEVLSRLHNEEGKSYVLVEMHQQRGEESVLASTDFPVQRMLLWPRQFQHFYKFVLRQTNKDGIVLYKGATKWQAKVNKESEQRNMVEKGFLSPSELMQDDTSDLCMLSELTQKQLMDVLKSRFKEDKIYTYSGEILISINPYKFLAIYNPKYMTMYQSRKREDLDPHIYAVADSAFTRMVEDKQNQCVVITGKSGSGKTQATHFLVHHTLALCQKSYMTGVEHMLVGCVPVLEALGNAQTEHNNNSSRFGKFLRIYFYESGLLSGADIQTYLLEKSRLVHQGINERNFHIFYYMLCGASDEDLKEFHLSNNARYNYIQSNMMTHAEAVAELERLKQAMEVVGFFAGAQKNIFKLIAAILLLGNVTFKVKKGREEALEIENETYLDSVSNLLALEPSFVKKCLLTRKARAGAGERFILDLKLNEAQATRDAMAKALYQSLFDWAVNSINMALAQRTRDSKLRAQSRWIGLLDIFGFEDFVSNSFEQFCINYASEHLQHHCIKHTFQVEQEIYKSEGLQWKEVDYADNSGCLELYEKKPTGLFYLIDENFPGANNQTLLAQFNRVHSANPYYETTVVKEDAFIIKHYAGKVKYQIKNFREKNHDQVREDIILMLRTSRSSFIQDVIAKSPAAVFRWSVLRAVVRAANAFRNSKKLMKDSPKHHLKALLNAGHDCKDLQAEYVHRKLRARLSHRPINQPSDNTSSFRDVTMYGKRKPTVTSRVKKKTNSIGQQHQASLASLMGALAKANPFFVRCIQPNNRKIPRQVDDTLVLHQLRCSGTLQTIQLQQSRYPNHFTADQFLREYRLLFPSTTRTLDLKQIRSFLTSIDLKEHTHFQIGSSLAFLRNPASKILRGRLHVTVLHSVISCQSCARRFLARGRYVRMREAAIKIQSFYRMVETQKMIEEWHLAASFIQEAWHTYRRRKCEAIIIKFQAHCRGYLLRKNVKLEIKLRHHSAVVIQSLWRRHKRRTHAAIVIQKVVRGFAARRSFARRQKILSAERETSPSVETETDTAIAVSPEALDAHGDAEKTPVENEVEQKNHQDLPTVPVKTNDPDITAKQTPDQPLSAKSEDSFDEFDDIPNHKPPEPSFKLPNDIEFIDDSPDKESEPDITDQRSQQQIQTNHKSESPVPEAKEKPPEKILYNGEKKRPSAGDILSMADDANQPTEKLSQGSSDNSLDEVSYIERFSKPTPPPNNRIQSEPPVTNKTPTENSSNETLKAGDLFLKAAFSNKSDRDLVKPVPFQPRSLKQNTLLREITKNTSDGPLPFIDDGSYNLIKESKKNSDSGTFRYIPDETSKPDPPSLTLQKSFSNPEKSTIETRSEERTPLKKISEKPSPVTDNILRPDDIFINADEKGFMKRDLSDTTRKSMSLPRDLKRAEEIALLQKEWLAFQRVERERQLRDLGRVHEGPKRENKRDRMIRDELTNMRLEQMSLLKEKMDSYGVSFDKMPLHELQPLSRRSSDHTDTDCSSPPTTPLTPNKEPVVEPSSPTPPPPPVSDALTEEKTFPRSVSMEMLEMREHKKPRRQRSNSAIEMYASRSPATDPVSRKFASSAEAFAKKYSDEDKNSSATSLIEEEEDKPKIPGPSEAKRGTFMEAVRKTFLGAHRGRQQHYLAEKKPLEGAPSVLVEPVAGGASQPSNKTSEEGESVKVRSLVAEEVSSKMFVTRNDELLLLKTFIKEKVASFLGSNLIDQVFKQALDEFCTNLTAIYSLTELSGDTNGIRYKDIINNFRMVLEKTTNNYQLDEYAAMMAVNGFRGYMDEFMNDVLPKHVVKESRSKRKKSKDEYTDKLGHHFQPVQWGVTQVCEACNSVMWLMESGMVCKVCKFALHKKCLKQLTQRCSGSPDTDKQRSKPKKLFGESIRSLVTAESSVPVFIDKCISYMEMNGIYQEGIYRKSAASTQIKQLEDELNKDIECEKVNFDDYQIHTVAAVFKKFLRALPQPLVPFDKYFEFLQASKLSNDREKVNSLFSVLEGIPQHNHSTLERIVFHLARVAQQEPTNRMSPSNLAIVFTPCFISPPHHVAPIEAASQVGDMTKGVETVITVQVQKIRSTLESISEIQNVESSTNERLQKIRQSMGRGNRKKIRPSFRGGPRSPTTRRSMRERRLDSVEEEEDVNLAVEEKKYEEKMATLRSRKETLTSKLPSLTPQNPNNNAHFFDDNMNDFAPSTTTNEFLRHLNKNRVSQLPRRRRPTRYASSVYEPQAPAAPKEGKALRKVSTPVKGKMKRLTALAKTDGDSFSRGSVMRHPIHRPNRKKGNFPSPGNTPVKMQIGKVTTV
uniref:Unconventional myosin-IXa n=1 Tax=Phallusia mammillata TaxID=59560 RepID=A0A6F9DMG7_9ASCI|nr:unconventional myosin-IXa [Phallusia mammillata]